MDTSGFCQVGRYGTLSLLKRNVIPVETTDDSIITSFGIDDEELTFGSSASCGVRLYYPDIDHLHCKIVFEQLKAFLAIFGASGVIVDGCNVYPHTSGENSAPQTIIPLNNNSVFEIHAKRFKFTYPPKELRKALYATPARPPQRALRLSMIHSAQVFSPRPSNDPRENLRILQSPLKNPTRSPAKYSSPLKSVTIPEVEEEDIVLVHTNHPRVVEEEKDLVILEDVPVQLLSPSKTPISASDAHKFPMIQSQSQPPSTPTRRRSLGGTALHRAVLIRSAQRAVLKAEKEKEEEEEELEVLGAVVDDEDRDGEVPINYAMTEDVEMRDVNKDNDDETDEEDIDQEKETQKPLWRKSLERIIPWSLDDSGVENENKDGEQDEDGDEDADTEDEEDNEGPAPLPVITSPSRKVLGSFMTPQPRHQGLKRNIFPGTQPAGPSLGPGRYSFGGGEAQRIIVQQPWKVRDLVLPPAAPLLADSHSFVPIDPPDSATSSFADSARPPATPVKSLPTAGTPGGVRVTPSVTEDERKAIQERRRSAVRELNSNSFWTGGVPGMSPMKGNLPSSSGTSSNIRSPIKALGTVVPSSIGRSNSRSPTKGHSLVTTIAEEDEKKPQKFAEDEDIDTHGLLEKMKETVNDMKRRRSVALGSGGVGSATPLVIASDTELLSRPTTPIVPASASAGNKMLNGSVLKKVDFTTMGKPSKPSSQRASSPRKHTSDHVETSQEEGSFSLLRPGVLEERRHAATSVSPPVQDENPVHVIPLPDIVIEDEGINSHEEPPTETTTRGRPRLLRSRHVKSEEGEADNDTGTKARNGTKLKPSSKAVGKPPSTRRQRSRTPQPPVEEVEESVDIGDGADPLPARMAKKAVAGPQQQQGQGDAVEKAPTRKGRKPRGLVKEPPTADEAVPIPVIAKKGRPRKKATPTVEDSPDEVPKRNQSKPPSTTSRKPASKTNGSKNNTAPATNEAESDDDPLNAYDIGVGPPGEEDEEVDVARQETTTGTKAKPRTASNKKKGTRVKQEEADSSATESLAVPVAKVRVGRTAKTNTVSQTPIKSTTTTTTTTTGKARTRPKTPATAPANTGTTIGAEKENAPGSTEKMSDAEADEAPPVKLRVSRSRAAAGNRKAIKAEDEDDQPTALPVRQRATRIMRTRTKTS